MTTSPFLDSLRFADYSGVIAWWLESECCVGLREDSSGDIVYRTACSTIEGPPEMF
jgi:hypothetical protein